MAFQGLKHANTRSAALVGLLLTTSAVADEPSTVKLTPHQVVHCMMKRLKADRSESYQAAFKTCKQELDSQTEPRSDTAMDTAASNDTPKR